MKQLLVFILFLSMVAGPSFGQGDHQPDSVDHETEQLDGAHDQEEGHSADPGNSPHPLSVIPFVLLLLMIATGPLFYEHFWHKNYPKISIAFAVIVVSYYLFVLDNQTSVIHAITEYVPFISLLGSLFIASGCIGIKVDKQSKPLTNVVILAIGAVIANIIGTTGASMLLIRPFIRLNKNRVRAYHIIFFIFLVSNVGGSLTPVGDPPLFLGFLKGVPFFWTLTHNLIPWAFAVLILLGVFFFIDRQNYRKQELDEEELEEEENVSGKVIISGARNFGWLALIVMFIFADPNVFDWVPYIPYHGQKISFVKELVWISIAFFSFRLTDKKLIKENEFSFEPIREVAFIFIGIFGAMMPALELVGDFAKSDAGAEFINHNTLYWGTGILSGFLDNAPTYLNFLAAAMASQGADISVMEQVKQFAMGGFHDSVLDLKAISIAAVFFGAMTYIGNGPNFMVKSIAEQIGIRMPSFFGYVIRFSIPILLPLLVIVWLIFFAGEPV